jgi:hypothetical protein
MTMVSMIEQGLEEQAMAAFWVAAEGADFHWEARVSERWLGRYESLDAYDDELDRVAIFGCLKNRWFAGIAVVDGNGAVQELVRCAYFEQAAAARVAFCRLR